MSPSTAAALALILGGDPEPSAPPPPVSPWQAADLETPVAAPPAPTIADDEPAPRLASPPSARPRVEGLPRYRGTGLLIAGSLIGLGGLGFRIAVTATSLPVDYNTDGHMTNTDTLRFGGIFAMLPIATGLGVVGGGLAKRGMWRAETDAARGEAPDRNYRLWSRLGWGLFGTGVGVWLTTRIFAAQCNHWVPRDPDIERASDDYEHGLGSERCYTAISEAGFYPSLAMATTGLALASYATAYRVRRKRIDALTFTPMVHRTMLGLSVSARF